jgi:UMF1 family MFS transporter
MLSLAPPDRLGEYYGLYAMVGRFAAMLGPLLWAVVVDGLGWGRPVAVAGLAVFVAVSMVLLSRVGATAGPLAADAATAS